MDWNWSQTAGDWQGKIKALKELVSKFPMWPKSTRLAGYGESGPYHCGKCKYLEGKDRCTHPVVKADPQVSKGKDGLPVINPERGCCEFVDQG